MSSNQFTHKTVLDQFLSHIFMVTESGCWIWMSHVNSTGYGMVMSLGKLQTAHRLSYKLFIGQIPDGLEIDHLCRVRCCVNPHHLEAVDHTTNMRRGIMKNTAKTHCKNGHPFDDKNTYWATCRGKRCRSCRACHARRELARSHG